MAGFFKKFFTWWSGNTLGTAFFTWRKGKLIGSDQFGNRYYQGSQDKEGKPRRWVIYKYYSEASMIPPGWHGWIHHRTNIAPVEETYQTYFWEKPHRPNLTGSSAAYRPKGYRNSHEEFLHKKRDYDSWNPD